MALNALTLGIKYKASHYCLKYGTTDHTRPMYVLHTVFLLNNYHRHHYFIVVFLENSENDSLKIDRLTLAFSRRFTFALLALAFGLWRWLIGLGFDTSGLVNIPAKY